MTVLAFLPSIRFFDYVLLRRKSGLALKNNTDDLQELDEQEKWCRNQKFQGKEKMLKLL